MDTSSTRVSVTSSVCGRRSAGSAPWFPFLRSGLDNSSRCGRNLSQNMASSAETEGRGSMAQQQPRVGRRRSTTRSTSPTSRSGCSPTADSRGQRRRRRAGGRDRPPERVPLLRVEERNSLGRLRRSPAAPARLAGPMSIPTYRSARRCATALLVVQHLRRVRDCPASAADAGDPANR